jgi:hypothetical protein
MVKNAVLRSFLVFVVALFMPLSTTLATPLRFVWGMQGDVVSDQARGKLYVAQGIVYPIDLATDTILYSQQLPGVGSRLDISPNGSLMVAGANASTGQRPNQSWVTIHDLDGGTSRDIVFPREPHESGVFDAVFADDHTVLVTSTYLGSGQVPLRRIDVNTGTVDLLGWVQQDATLEPSGDRSIVAFAGGNNSGGPFGYYDVEQGVLHAGGRAWAHLGDITTNRDGSRFAVPTIRGVEIFDRSFSKLTEIPGQFPNHYPLDSVYSPAGDVLYVSWSGTDGIPGAWESIVAYDAFTLAALETIDTDSEKFNSLTISRDGRQLYAVQSAGSGGYIYDVSQFVIPEPAAAFLLTGGLLGSTLLRSRCRSKLC